MRGLPFLRHLRDSSAGFRCVLGILLWLLPSITAGTELARPELVGAQEVASEAEADRVPLVLVPGWGDAASELEALRRRFVDAGWPENRILVVSFEDPYGSSASHAPEIRHAVETLRELTGASVVDIVAHSMGGLAVRGFLESVAGEEGPVNHVRRVVFLGTPHRGTVAAVLAWGEGGREMTPGSSFLQELNADPPLPETVEALSIRTPIDLRVVPGSSAMLPGAWNAEVCCPTHQGLLHDPDTFAEMRGFLIQGPDGLSEPDETVPLRGELPEWIDSLP